MIAGFCVVVWDRNDYIAEAEKQLGDKNIFQDVNFSDKILRDLVDKSNKIFRSLKSQGKVTEKELKYLDMNVRKLLIEVRCIYFLMFLVDQLSRTVSWQQRKFQNF